MEKILSENLKVLYLPIGIILIIIILFFISLKVFTDRLGLENSQLSQAKGQEVILNQKLNSLQTIGQVVNQVEAATFALPDQNPSFIEVSQVKRYVQSFGLALNNIQIGVEIPASSGISKSDVSFDVEGSYLSILALIDKLKNASPLTTVTNISLSQKSGATLGSISLSLFWSAYPQKLPALTEPISELTGDEIDILSKINALEKPILAAPTQASPSGTIQVKTNPFGF